ncbi:hypothetical protein ABPG74_013468 [Tetrahymena malaccensis]
MGQAQTKEYTQDPNQVISKEEYEDNIKNFNQFVRSQSQKNLIHQNEDQSQLAKSTITNTKAVFQYENEENYDNKNEISNYNQFIGKQDGDFSRFQLNKETIDYTISDWIALIIKNMSEVGFEGEEYEIHHTDVSIKIVLLFTAMNYKKIDAFVSLNNTLWMEFVLVEIHYHMFDKVGIARICNSIQKLYHLQYLVLDFSHNKMAMNNECVSNCVTNLPDLKVFTLNIEGNNIGEEGVRLISKSMSNLKFLNQLNLNFKWNKLKDSGLFYVSNTIAQMRFINQLSIDVSANQLTESSLILLFDAISIIGKLQQLSINISHNDVNQEGGIALGECIKQQENLVELTLWLDNNNLTQHGSYPILEALKQIYNLVKLDLDLSFNNIPVYEAKDIRDQIHLITNIRQKNLRFF